jgi:hypothetical protein
VRHVKALIARLGPGSLFSFIVGLL